MSTPTPPGQSSPAPEPRRQLPSVVLARPRYRGAVLAGVLVLLLAGGAGAWWWWPRAAPVLPPPAPPIEDAEVRREVERVRQQVLSSPESAAAWGRLGKVLLAHMFADEADVCFARAARLDPTDARWPYARGWLAVRHDPQKPVALLREAVAKGDSRPAERSAMTLQLAEALLERNDLEEAEGFFREELGRQPNNPRAALGLGLIAADRGDELAARKLLAVARASPYGRKRASVKLAALARARGDQETADGYEKQAAQLPEDPQWPDPLHDELADLRVGRVGRERLASMLESQGRLAEAAQVYLDQIDQEPNVVAYVGAGMSFARLRNFDRALPLLREALRLGPDNAEPHFCMALTLYTRAEQQWKAAPGSARAGKDFQEAVSYSRQATTLRPDHARAYLVRGLSLKYLGKPAEAVAPLRKGLACAPTDLDLLLGLGEVLLEVGQLKEAAVHLENARRLAPNDPRPTQALERLRSVQSPQRKRG